MPPKKQPLNQQQQQQQKPVKNNHEHSSDEASDTCYNVEFYKNAMPLVVPLPTAANNYNNQVKLNHNVPIMLRTIHDEWRGKYKLLEQCHFYIQWLFPSNEKSGNNEHCYVLTDAEAQQFRQSCELQDRLLQSFELILDFFGLEFRYPPPKDNSSTATLLHYEQQQQQQHSKPSYSTKLISITKSSNAQHYKERFVLHLNKTKNIHNYLRITRIIKCLCLCGLECVAITFTEFLINQIMINKELSNKDVKQSLIKHWIPAITVAEERERLGKLAAQYK